jgi:DinB superfamily
MALHANDHPIVRVPQEEWEMSERTEVHAVALERANAEAIAFAESCPEASWTATCVNDGRTVAAVVRHVGGAYIAHARLVQAVADGAPIPEPFTDWALIHRGNDIAAQRYAHADRRETLASLQRNGANLASVIRGLSDAQLDRTAVIPIFGAEPQSTDWYITHIFIPHVHGHLTDLHVTVAQGDE